MNTTDPMNAFAEAFADSQKNVRFGDEIDYPIQVSDINILNRPLPRSERCGQWVSIRPCDDEKTYLGVYLGDLTIEVYCAYRIDTNALDVIPHGNPAIFVPDLNRVVWGCESWWGVISKPEDLRKITDADIQDIWYVKVLKALQGEEEAPA